MATEPIRKLGDKYQLDFRPNGYKGKRIIKLFKTKTEAKLYYQKTLTGRVEPIGDNRTLNELISIWYELHGHTLKSSKDTKNRLLTLSNSVGNLKANKYTSEIFAIYRKNRLDKGITPATLNRELSTIKALYRELKRLDVINYDSSILNIRKIKEAKTKLTFLNENQIQLIIKETKASKNESLYFVVLLCLASGARWSEAEGVKISDFTKEGVNYHDTKNGCSRFVPLAQNINAQLKGYLKNNNGFKSCYSAYRSAFTRSKIQCPKGQLAHILRHTFASHFIMNGGNIKALQEILGHSSLQMTMRYAHLSPDFLSQAKQLNPLAKLDY